jgi:gibberellin 20-oxidase
MTSAAGWFQTNQNLFCVLLQILSNKRYKSVLHRAIVNGTSKRLSMACFLNPPLSATIVAPDELITPQRPRIYRAFTFQDFLSNAYTHHPKGAERPEQYHLAQA